MYTSSETASTILLLTRWRSLVAENPRHRVTELHVDAQRCFRLAQSTASLELAVWMLGTLIEATGREQLVISVADPLRHVLDPLAPPFLVIAQPAPEQRLRRHDDVGSGRDIFAIGVVAAGRLLTGSSLFPVSFEPLLVPLALIAVGAYLLAERQT